jgi:hypothetical protein
VAVFLNGKVPLTCEIRLVWSPGGLSRRHLSSGD